MWDKIISIIMDVPQNDLEVIPLKTKKLLIVFLSPLMMNDELIKHNNYRGNKYIDLNNITLGDFIDLDIWINEGVDKNIYHILKKLYGVDIDEYTTIDKVLGGVFYYIKWRNNIYYQYKNLFGIGDDYAQDDEETIKVNIKKNWFDIIMVLSKDDVLRMNQVVNLPLLQSFNWLAWNKEKIEKEKDELQKRSKHNKNHM